MRLEYQILAAVALDLVLGDPRWLPHPVRGIGWLAQRLEAPARNILPRPRAAGICVATIVVTVTGLAAWGLTRLAWTWNSIAADAVAVLLIYTAIAPRDLARHSMAVYRALNENDLPEARRRVGMIVGRDTENLDEPEVARAAVESVAESIVDGVTAPIFYAVLTGPVGAMVYRAVNTLDSTFGYRNERYRRFGSASARLDDVASFVPARLTAPLVGVAAWALGERAGDAFRVLRRDGRNHASPNSGLAEAAVAGALGVRLGGLNYYDGEPSPKPALGDADEPLAATHIRRANGLMFASCAIFLAVCLAARVGVVAAWKSMGGCS